MTEDCGHNFCHTCISEFVGRQEFWNCPECRSVQEKHPRQLMRNRLAERAVESFPDTELQKKSKNMCRHHNLEPNMPRQGVVKFTQEQLNNIVDAILSTAHKVQVPRCGASYLLFMALRHTDNTNDDNLLKVWICPYQSDDGAIRADLLFLI